MVWPFTISVNLIRRIPHLSWKKASCRRTDADVRVLWQGEGEQTGHYRRLDPWRDWLSILVTARLMVAQEQHGSGLVTYCCGSKLNQKMGELQWWVDTHCSARQQKISDDKMNGFAMDQ